MRLSFVRYAGAGATIFLVTACGNDSDVLAPELTCQAPAIDFPATSAGSPVAFVNVNVLPMNDGPVLVDHTVVVRGDRIVAVGPSADVTVSDEAVQIDGRCRVLMPGLADMHVHLAFRSEATLLVANGITTAREMWGSPGHLTFRDEILAGDEFGPSLVVGSQGFRATEWLGAIVMNDPSEADSAVAALQAAGFDFIKVHEDLSAVVYDAVVASAQNRGIPVDGHAPFPAGLQRVLDSEQRSIEHLSTAFLPLIRASGNSSGWYHTALDAQRIQSLARLLREEGAWVTPTLVTVRKAFSPDEVAEFPSLPEARYLHPDRIATWLERGPWLDWTIRDAALAGELRVVTALAQEGVKFLVGTDGGFTYLTPGFTMQEELELYVQAGLTPEQILRAATRNAAEFLDQVDEFGMVAEGLRADLILLDAHPLIDIANVGRRTGVMLRGEWYSQEELQRRLDEIAVSFTETAAGTPAAAEESLSASRN